ncbi:uncharacterized protein LOC143858434 [Tasmannia lanceolata]|uniref:uncharacterized protein LOC143858434 n=1 Tax=Tasmannia lanceolata TaxID=3420 RepID=UPI004063B330
MEHNSPVNIFKASVKATGESSFSLTFGVEAIIPVEIGIPSPLIEAYDEQVNPELLRNSLDLVEERREKARIKNTSYQQRVVGYYNSRMKERVLRVGDLVLRRAEVSDLRNSVKLAPTWEGPYRVARILRLDAYRLERLDGMPIPRRWNIGNLKKYYQ